MKRPIPFIWITQFVLSLMLILLTSNISTFAAIDEKIESLLTSEEADWLLQHQSETLYVGLDPEAGMEYFSYNGREMGYLKSIVQMLSEKLDLNLQIRPDLSWSEAVSGLQSNEIQILFGANTTE